jgi:hypothetical protein
MIYFIALIPATALTIAGYFVLYLSNRSEGALRTMGKYLGFWAFTLAGLIVLGAIFAAAHGGRHGPMLGVEGMDGRMHGPWSGDPRSCGPRVQEPRGDTGGLGGPPHRATSEAPAGAPDPTTAPGRILPSPR